jgi:hypothetical protein
MPPCETFVSKFMNWCHRRGNTTLADQLPSNATWEDVIEKSGIAAPWKQGSQPLTAAHSLLKTKFD